MTEKETPISESEKVKAVTKMPQCTNVENINRSVGGFPCSSALRCMSGIAEVIKATESNYKEQIWFHFLRDPNI